MSFPGNGLKSISQDIMTELLDILEAKEMLYRMWDRMNLTRIRNKAVIEHLENLDAVNNSVVALPESAQNSSSILVKMSMFNKTDMSTSLTNNEYRLATFISEEENKNCYTCTIS